MKALLCCAGVVFLSATQICPGQSPAAAESTRVIRSSAREVLLDFVVRDKRERPVRDLRPEEVEVYEDGIRQDVRAFRLIEGHEAKEAEDRLRKELSPTPKASLNPVRQINLVSLVFQQMSWENRKNAKEAAEEFIKNELRPNTYIGIFSLDRRLNGIANFTSNKDTLFKAVATATSGSYTEFAKISASVMKATEFAVTGGRGGIEVQGGGVDINSPTASTTPADVPTSEASSIMYGILNRERLRFNHISGMEQMDALLTLIQEQTILPGRKTVVLFTEGVVVPANFMERFRFVISSANRAGVTFYGVDVSGLTTFSRSQANLAMTRALNTAPAAGAENVAADPSLHADEVLQYSLRAANTQESLAQLADDTGGFMIANTNEWKKQLRKIMEDVNTHYEVAYAPKNPVDDGGFRKIELKVARPNVTLQSRRGYFALPELNGKQLMAFEVACLQALDSNPRPHSFDFQAAALRYRPGTTVQHQVILEVPVKAIGSREELKSNTHVLHTSMMAVVRDSKDTVVAKISRDLSFSVPDNKYEQFQRGNVIYTEPVYLLPGRYRMDAVVVDRVGGKASVMRSSLVVPAPANGPEIGAPVVVRSLEANKEAPDPADALQFAGGKVIPTLSPAPPKGISPAIYFVVYPSAEATVIPTVTVEFFRDGSFIGRETPQPGQFSSDGIPMLVGPKLPAGRYDVRITAVDGNRGARQNTVLEIQ
jgi:VWFA-related protein